MVVDTIQIHITEVVEVVTVVMVDTVAVDIVLTEEKDVDLALPLIMIVENVHLMVVEVMKEEDLVLLITMKEKEDPDHQDVNFLSFI